MKQFLLFSITLSLFAGSLFAQQKPAYSIKITLKDYSANEIYLGYTFADKKYLKDTAKVQKKGVFVFEGNEPLSGGVFFIYTPNKLFFELLVDENQHFSIESDTANFVKNAKIKDSQLNTVFFDFVNKAAPKQAEIKKLDDRLRVLDKTKNADSIKFVRSEIERIDNEIRAMQDNIISQNPNLFFSKLLKGMREPDLNIARKMQPAGEDSIAFQAKYFKDHYWDNFDWNDNKLAYSEIFFNKLKFYFNRLVIPQHDTLISEAKMVFKNAQNSKDLTKYATVYLYVFGDTSRVMGAENLAVYVGKNYYTKERADWADSTSISKIQEHVKSLEPLILGKVAPNLRLADTTGKNFINMAEIKAKYTVVIFWDPTCGHCQKEMPKLQSFYPEWKKQGIEIFGVYTQREVEEWKKFIRDKKLTFLQGAVWPDMAINPEKYIYEMGVTDIQSLNVHKTYYISSTPQIYLLDENKVIVGRRLNAEGIPKLIEGLEKQKERKNKP